MTSDWFAFLVFVTRACLLTCESNEIPLPDCSGCGPETLITQIITNSKPPWAQTITTEQQQFQGATRMHSTQLIGTTGVVTHGSVHPDGSTPLPTEETKKDNTGFTTLGEWPFSTKIFTTGEDSTTRVHPTEAVETTDNSTTKLIPTKDPATTLTAGNHITTQVMDSTTAVATRNVTIPTASSTENQTLSSGYTPDNTTVSARNQTAPPTTPQQTEITTTMAPTTQNSTTKKVTTRRFTTARFTTKMASGAMTTPIVDLPELTTQQEEVVTIVPTKGEEGAGKEEGSGGLDNTGSGSDGDGSDSSSGEETDSDEESTDDNAVSTDDNAVEPTVGFCIGSDQCFNGGVSVCRNGAFDYCQCSYEFLGRYCEYERSLTNVDDKRPSNSFWDWKLSKYMLGGLGVLTLVGVLMLTCMVVRCVRGTKSDERRREDYNDVGMQFLPSAPVVVPGTRLLSVADRGSSDVMDERSEEEFPLHEAHPGSDSDSDPVGSASHLSRPSRPHTCQYPPDPLEDDGLHHAPSHPLSPGGSDTTCSDPRHYKVPRSPNSRPEYMNMDAKPGVEPSAYMNGNANTYSHKLAKNGEVDMYAHLNRSYSRTPNNHNYLNIP